MTEGLLKENLLAIMNESTNKLIMDKIDNIEERLSSVEQTLKGYITTDDSITYKGSEETSLNIHELCERTSHLTEKEFISALENDVHGLVGKTVTLENRMIVDNIDQTYMIVGLNHGLCTKEPGYLDLISVNCITKMQWGRDTDWVNSNIRSWLNKLYYEEFSDELKKYMIPVRYISINKNTLESRTMEDYVIIPSVTEITPENFFTPNNFEGVPYKIFPNWLKTYDNGNKTVVGYWTRSTKHINSEQEIYIVSDDGEICSTPTYEINFGVVPIIRFKINTGRK